jgi:hypothetical protein
MQMYRDVTKDEILLCGRKTYESLPEQAIKDRSILVFSRNPEYKVDDERNHIVVNSIDEFLKMKFAEDIFIIGGAEIYNLFLPRSDLILDNVCDFFVASDGKLTKIVADDLSFMLKEFGSEQIRCLDGVTSCLRYKEKTLKIESVINKIRGVVNSDRLEII